MWRDVMAISMDGFPIRSKPVTIDESDRSPGSLAPCRFPSLDGYPVQDRKRRK
jgi:hypothetical protein